VKAPRLVHVDFAAPVRRAPVVGAVLCVLGIAASASIGVSFAGQLAERGRLDAELGAVQEPHRAAAPVDSKAAEDAAAMQRELAVPWSQLLAELEDASHDSSSTIALLQVEPDAAKRLVRITAEARSLPAALDYLQRLQKCPLLRYPMLESHEKRKDDPMHPIRVKLVAEWRG